MTFTTEHITEHWRQAQAAGARRQSIQAGWTDEKVETLRSMVDQRGMLLSAGDMAKQLGVTRNAVIGKARRMGWTLPLAAGTSYRTKETKPRKPPNPRKPLVRAPRQRHTPTRIERLFKEALRDIGPAPYVPPFEQRRLIMQLTTSTCRFPIGEPGAHDFCYCGGRTFEDLPYCRHHCRIAYRPDPLRPLRWGWR